MRRLLPAVLLAVGACSAATVASVDDASNNNTRSVSDGALRFTTTDYPTQAGFLFARPTPVVSPASIALQSTRYGSLCRFEVTPKLTVTDGSIVMHVNFAERATVCTAEIRALRYEAQIGVPKGSYDLTVVHDEGAQSDTVVHQQVVVP
jgi:hypothetical protein